MVNEQPGQEYVLRQPIIVKPGSEEYTRIIVWRDDEGEEYDIDFGVSSDYVDKLFVAVSVGEENK